MSSSIGEPFQLYLSSTFSQKVSPNHQAVYATYNSSFRNHATVTGQMDGIHVWDLKNLHSVVSYSVGEHVSFSAPVFSRCVVEDRMRSVTSYAVIRQAPDIVKANRERTIWIITQSLSGPASLASGRTAVVVPHPPVRICGTDNESLPLLLVSRNGGVCLANARVEIKNQLEWPGERQLLEVFVFPSNATSLIQQDAGSNDTVAAVCCQAGSTLHVRLVLLGEEIIDVGSCELPIGNSTSNPDTCLLGLTCSPSGILSLMNSRGEWMSYQLSCPNSSLLATTVAEPLSLRRFSVLKSKKPSLGASFSTVSLGSSLVLLAALVDGTQDISLQIWDLRYGVLLATQSMSAPSSLLLPHLSLSVVDEEQVLLTLSPSHQHNKSQGSPPRSAIYVVPVDPALKSNLAAALGKTASTAEWLVPQSAHAQEPAKDDEEGNLIFTIQSSIRKKKTQKADEAFFAWVKTRTTTKSAFSLGHEFVKKIINTILLPEPPTDYQYSPRIVRYLLENGMVSTIMLNGKLLTMLRQRGDWESLMLALHCVDDISEDEMISSAKFLIDRQRKRENNPDAMEVDATVGYVPPLGTYLSACVSYSSTPAAMRLAIRKYLSDAQDLVVILETLESWIHGGTEQYMEGLLKSMATNSEMQPSGVDSPPYSKVITFLQALLDASFVSLLQYQPSHEPLRRILSQIEPEINYIDRMEQLRGVLEPFTKAHARSLKERAGGIPKETPAEWKKRKKRLEQQATLGVGLYRLEELVI
ncbi:hypothetical protein HYDPIDRAFT_178256 [Hydnomerulius pinastri MD-312]|nr:hypothetical protein HYDPIDRAFT_178256 [Hydnomerulius pinastri MD-312]